MASNEISLFLFRMYTFRLLEIPFIHCLFYKQPAVTKNDEATHHPTGNLPPTFYTSAERQMANHLANHRFVTGIEGGFDSDGKSNLINKMLFTILFINTNTFHLLFMHTCQQSLKQDSL